MARSLVAHSLVARSLAARVAAVGCGALVIVGFLPESGSGVVGLLLLSARRNFLVFGLRATRRAASHTTAHTTHHTTAHSPHHSLDASKYDDDAAQRASTDI